MRASLVHIQPLVIAANLRVDVRIGSAGSSNDLGLMGEVWEPALDRAPELSIELMSPEIDGRVQPGKARFRINLKNIRRVTNLDGLSWRGAPVTIMTDEAAQDLGAVPEFYGLITGLRPDIDKRLIEIEAEVSTALIDKPMLTAKFDGSAGMGGGAAKRGTLLPAGFGDVLNIEPIWFDEVRNIGMIDGYQNTQSINWLGEGLSSLGPRVDDYPTYAALAAAIDAGTVTPGRWASCVAQGLVGLGAPPTGIVTVHAVFGTNRPGSLMRRWIETHAGVAPSRVDSAAFTALDLLVDRAVFFWTANQITVKSAMEQLAASCNATPLVTFQGKVSVTRAIGGSVAGTLDRSGGTLPRVIDWRTAGNEAPFYELKARTARPARVLSRDQVNFVDTLVDRGLFDIATVYRAGNIVWLLDGSSWAYKDVAPSAGNVPVDGSAFWENQTPPTKVDWSQIENQYGTKPSDNAGTTVNLVDVSTADSLKIVGNSVAWRSTNSAWSVAAMSQQSAVGGFDVSCRLTTAPFYGMFGATYVEAPTAPFYNSGSWLIYANNSVYTIYERNDLGVTTDSTPNVNATLVPTAGDELRVFSNDVFVQYYVRGRLIHISSNTPTQRRVRILTTLGSAGGFSDIQMSAVPSAMLAAKPNPGQNIIFNGDAEAGTTAGWVVAGGPDANKIFKTDTAVKQSGARSFRIQKPTNAGHSIDVASRAWAVTPNEKWQIKLWLYGNNVSSAGGLYVRMWQRASEPATGTIAQGSNPPFHDAADTYVDVLGGQTWPLGPSTLDLEYTVPAGVYWVSLGLYSYLGGPSDAFFEVAMKRVVDWDKGIGGGPGTGKPENNADVTANNQAASIVNQGDFALLDYATLGANIQDGGGYLFDREDLANWGDEFGLGRVSRPRGGSKLTSSVVTGALKIQLPFGPSSNRNTMLKFTCDVYEYNMQASQTYELAGYIYAGGPFWTQTSARMIGGSGSAKTIRFGRDTSGKWAIWVGEPGTSWFYPQISLRDLILGYSNTEASAWKSGWALSFDTATATNVDQNVTNPNAGDAVFGINARETADGAIATLAEFKTFLGMAGALYGSGNGAYANTLAELNSGEGAKFAGIETNADVTLLMVPASRDFNVQYDYTGITPKAGEFPRTDYFKLMNSAGTDVTALATWSASFVQGSGLVASIVGGATTSSINSDSVIKIEGVYNGKTRSGFLGLKKNLDPPPVGGSGGGGTSGSGALDDSTTRGATYGSGSGPVLSAAAGASGQIMVSAATTFRTAGSGYRSTWGKWQWRTVGGSFADVATEQGSAADSYRSTISGELEDSAGTLNVAMTKTGLTPGTTYEFQFFYRSDSGNVRFLVGTGSAVGS